MFSKPKPAEVGEQRLRPPPSLASLLFRLTVGRLLAAIAWYAVPVLGLGLAIGIVLWLMFFWQPPHG